MSKLKAFVVLFLIISSSVLAQRDPQYSMNFYNQLAFNPGYAGSNDAICAVMLYRNQWMGFDGTPKTMAFSVHGPIESISSGVGLSILQDKAGFGKDFLLNLDYAYKMELGDGKLGLGLGLGLINRSLDGEWESPDVLWGNTQNAYDDPLIPHSGSHFSFDSNFGAFYIVDDKDHAYYAGLSITHLNKPQVKIDKENTEFHSYFARHLYLSGGYNYALPNGIIDVQPMFILQTDGVSAQYNFNLRAVYQKQFWGGISYRVSDAIVPMIGANLAKPAGLGIGVAYDITLSNIAEYSDGSIEFYLRYCFNIESSGDRGTYKSVRFL